MPAPANAPIVTTSGIAISTIRAAALAAAANTQKATFLQGVADAIGADAVAILSRNDVTHYQDNLIGSLVVSSEYMTLPGTLNEPPEINLSGDADTGDWVLRIEKATDSNICIKMDLGSQSEPSGLILTEDLDGARFIKVDGIRIWAPSDLGDAYASLLSVDMSQVDFVNKGAASTGGGVTSFENELIWGYQTPINGGRGIFWPDNTYQGFDNAHLKGSALGFTPLETDTAPNRIRMNAARASAADVTYLNSAPVTGTGNGTELTIDVNGYTARADYLYVEINGVETQSYTAIDQGKGKYQVVMTVPNGQSYYVQTRPHIYHSSAMTLRNRLSMKYGRAKCTFRCLTPGNGFWFGFWLIPFSSDPSSDKLPPELDVIEVGIPEGQTTVQCHFATHGPVTDERGKYSNNSTKNNSGWLNLGDMTEYHTVECIWDSDTITWYFDGVERHQVPNITPRAGFHEFMYPKFTIEISPGGLGFVRSVDGTTPSTMGVEITGLEFDQTPDQAAKGPTITQLPVIAGSNGLGDTITLTTQGAFSGGNGVSHRWYSGNFDLNNSGTNHTITAADGDANIWVSATSTDNNNIPTIAWSNPIWVPPISVDVAAETIAEMSISNEVTLDGADPSKGWANDPIMAMGNKNRGDAAPTYWQSGGSQYTDGDLWEAINFWFVFYPGVGNNYSANARVAIRNARVQVQRESTREWTLLDTNSAFGAVYYDANIIGSGSSVDVRTVNGVQEFKMPLSGSGFNNIHGWGSPKYAHSLIPFGSDIRAIYVDCEVRLVKDVAAGADDLGSSVICFNCGADYKHQFIAPYGSNQVSAYVGDNYAPGVMGNRFATVGTEWQTRRAATINAGGALRNEQPVHNSAFNAITARTISTADFTSELPL